MIEDNSPLELKKEEERDYNYFDQENFNYSNVNVGSEESNKMRINTEEEVAVKGKKRGRKKKTTQNYGLELSEILTFLNSGRSKHVNKSIGSNYISGEFDCSNGSGKLKSNYYNSLVHFPMPDSTPLSLAQTLYMNGSNLNPPVKKRPVYIGIRENNFSLHSHPKMIIKFSNISLKFSVSYSSETQIKFGELRVSKFSNHRQTERLFDFLNNTQAKFNPLTISSTTKLTKYQTIQNYLLKSNSYIQSYIKSHLISAFSIAKLYCASEDMFNFLSNFKSGQIKFALLENKIDKHTSLILIDSSRFYFSKFLPVEFDLCIMAVKNSILQEEFQISKPLDLAVIKLKNYDSLYEEEIKTRKSENLAFLDFTEISDHNRFLLEESQVKLAKVSCEMKNLRNSTTQLTEENAKLKGILSSQTGKEDYYQSKCEFLQKENVRLNVLVEDSMKIMQKKIEYFEDKHGVKVEFVDGFIFESKKEEGSEQSNKSNFSEEKENPLNIESPTIKVNEDPKNLLPNQLINTEIKQFLENELYTCILCYENLRDCVFTKCGHIVYCYECAQKLTQPPKKRGRKPASKHLICPSCNSDIDSFMKITYS